MDNEGVRNLMAAIMEKTVNDYKEKSGIGSCKSFFNSQWCDAICDVLDLNTNGKEIMKMLDGGVA